MTDRRIHFDPTINLGHLMSAGMSLLALGVMYGTFSSQLATLARDQLSHKSDQREATMNVENRLMTRINDERIRLDQTQVRTSDDIREIKTIVRDGFRDLDAKLDRKADKPGR